MRGFYNVPEVLKAESSFSKNFPNKRMLKKLRKQIFCYSETFSSTLSMHLKTEFEINVRDGEIVPKSYAKMEILQKEFQILQFEDNLEAIFCYPKTFCKSAGSRSSLDEVYNDTILSFKDLVKTIQENILTERRKTDNQMCNKKIKKGPEIFNFTTKQIPPTLQKHLASGLNNVRI